MRLSLRAMALAGGLIWGAALLGVGLLNLADRAYGTAFLQMLSSVYPWFHPSGTVTSVIVGTLWGILDGVLTGFERNARTDDRGGTTARVLPCHALRHCRFAVPPADLRLDNFARIVVKH